jgi:transcriptional regulator with XRE-family HTH domain
MNKLRKAIDRVCGEMVKGKNQFARANMHQDELARKIGVCPESLSRWANGVRQPKLMARVQLNGFFGEEIFPISKAEMKTVRQIQGIKGLIGRDDITAPGSLDRCDGCGYCNCGCKCKED